LRRTALLPTALTATLRPIRLRGATLVPAALPAPLRPVALRRGRGRLAPVAARRARGRRPALPRGSPRPCRCGGRVARRRPPTIVHRRTTPRIRGHHGLLS